MNVLAVLLALLVTGMIIKSRFFGFRAQSPADYAAKGPVFDLKQHLSGPIRSEGVIFGPAGRMTNSFVASMLGEWNGDSGTLTEDFTYSNGSRLRRKWYLTLGAGNSFTATADDIVGVAKGVVSGSTVMLRYKIILPPSAGGHSLQVTDWMFLTQDGAIINKSEMTKFGIKVAELVATLRPEPKATD